MANCPQQSLQEFFDSPAVRTARYRLSASAAEPVGMQELLALEPGAAEKLIRIGLDYPQRYASTELSETVANKYEGIDTEGVLITSGVDEALGLLFLTLVEPGDRVIVLTPCYPPQLELPRWRGAEVVPWPAREENDWVPDLDELRGLTGKPTKLVITTFPQNPTGFMPSDAYQDNFISILRDSGAILLSDEIYAGLPVGGAGAPNLASRFERAVSLNGLSKTCGLPGLRVGWLVTRDQSVMNAVKQVKILFNCYLPGPVEYLSSIAFRHEPALRERSNAILAAGLEASNSFFKRHDNLFAWTPPQAGVLSFPRWFGPGGTKELSDRLIGEASLALAPSLCFDAGDHHFRIGLCRKSIADALRCFDEFLATEY